MVESFLAEPNGTLGRLPNVDVSGYVSRHEEHRHHAEQRPR
jgi:hypothetical protein